jgi:hypothetical protein
VDKVRTGLELRRDLGLLYLDQRRWQDADQFFNELLANPNQVPAYLRLGKLGHAVVLGLQNQPAASNDAFLDLLGKDSTGKRVGLEHTLLANIVLRNLSFRQWIAEALEYNYRNAPQQFPAPLEQWRKPSFALPRPGGTGAKTGGK